MGNLERQTRFIQDMRKMPGYAQGWSDEDIRANVKSVLESNDPQRINRFVTAINQNLPGYKSGWDAKAIEDNVRDVFRDDAVAPKTTPAQVVGNTLSAIGRKLMAQLPSEPEAEPNQSIGFSTPSAIAQSRGEQELLQTSKTPEPGASIALVPTRPITDLDRIDQHLSDVLKKSRVKENAKPKIVGVMTPMQAQKEMAGQDPLKVMMSQKDEADQKIAAVNDASDTILPWTQTLYERGKALTRMAKELQAERSQAKTKEQIAVYNKRVAEFGDQLRMYSDLSAKVDPVIDKVNKIKSSLVGNRAVIKAQEQNIAEMVRAESPKFFGQIDDYKGIDADIAKAASSGSLFTMIDLANAKDMLTGGKHQKELERVREMAQMAVEDNPQKAKTIIGKVLNATVEMLPAMGAGVAANMLVPGAGTAFWIAQGTGNQYANMRRTGMSHNVAASVSAPVGVLYGLIENLQLGQITKSAQDAAANTLRRWIAEKGADYVKENMEEVFQQMTQDAGNILGSALDKKGISAQDFKTMADNAFQTLTASAGPLGLLSAVGLAKGAIDIGVSRVRQYRAEDQFLKDVANYLKTNQVGAEPPSELEPPETAVAPQENVSRETLKAKTDLIFPLAPEEEGLAQQISFTKAEHEALAQGQKLEAEGKTKEADALYEKVKASKLQRMGQEPPAKPAAAEPTPKSIKDVLDPISAAKAKLQRITDPDHKADLEANIELMQDQLFNVPGDHAVKFQNISMAQRALDKANVPYAYVRADIQNLKGLNETKGHEGANEVLRATLGKTLIKAINAAGGMVGRDSGDELKAILPNMTEAQATELIEKARKQAQAEIKKQGLDKITHARYNLPNFGAGDIVYGVTASVPGHYGAMDREADSKADVMKSALLLDKAKEQDYIEDKETGKYVRRTEKAPAGDAAQRGSGGKSAPSGEQEPVSVRADNGPGKAANARSESESAQEVTSPSTTETPKEEAPSVAAKPEAPRAVSKGKAQKREKPTPSLPPLPAGLVTYGRDKEAGPTSEFVFRKNASGQMESSKVRPVWNDQYQAFVVPPKRKGLNKEAQDKMRLLKSGEVKAGGQTFGPEDAGVEMVPVEDLPESWEVNGEKFTKTQLANGNYEIQDGIRLGNVKMGTKLAKDRPLDTMPEPEEEPKAESGDTSFDFGANAPKTESVSDQVEAAIRTAANKSREANDPISDAHVRGLAERLADAIKAKRVQELREMLNPYMNPAWRAGFEALTGKKLPATQKGTDAVLREFVGAAEYDKQVEARKAAREKQREDSRAKARQQMIDEATAGQYQLAGTDKVMNGKEFIEDAIANGYTDIVEGKRGATTTYLLKNPKTGKAFQFKKGQIEYAKDVLAKQAPVVETESNVKGQEVETKPSAAQAEAGNYKKELQKLIPPTVVHGSLHKFKQFDKSKIGSRTDHGWRGVGFYFAKDPVYSYRFTGKKGYLTLASIRMKNPFLWTDKNVAKILGIKSDSSLLPMAETIMSLEPDEAQKFTEKLKQAGYDGIIKAEKPMLNPYPLSEDDFLTLESAGFGEANFEENKGKTWEDVVAGLISYETDEMPWQKSVIKLQEQYSWNTPPIIDPSEYVVFEPSQITIQSQESVDSPIAHALEYDFTGTEFEEKQVSSDDLAGTPLATDEARTTGQDAVDQEKARRAKAEKDAAARDKGLEGTPLGGELEAEAEAEAQKTNLFEQPTAAQQATKEQIRATHDTAINPKVVLLVDALNKRDIHTSLSGDLYGKDLVYVDLADDAVAEKIQNMPLPKGWGLVLADIAASEAFVEGTADTYTGPRDSIKKRLIRKGGAVSATEADAVANAVQQAIADSTTTPFKKPLGTIQRIMSMDGMVLTRRFVVENVDHQLWNGPQGKAVYRVFDLDVNDMLQTRSGPTAVIEGEFENDAKKTGANIETYDARQVLNQAIDQITQKPAAPVAFVNQPTLSSVINLPTMYLTAVVNQYAKKYADVPGDLQSLLRKDAGQKPWAEMTEDERQTEVRAYIQEDMMVAAKEAEGKDPVAYLSDRALDPLDPLNEFYAGVLRAMGINAVAGKSVEAVGPALSFSVGDLISREGDEQVYRVKQPWSAGKTLMATTDMDSPIAVAKTNKTFAPGILKTRPFTLVEKALTNSVESPTLEVGGGVDQNEKAARESTPALGEAGAGTLEGVPANPVPGPGVQGNLGGTADTGRQPNRGSDVELGGGEQAEPRGGMAGGERPIPVPASGNRPANPGRGPQLAPGGRAGNTDYRLNYRITDADNLGKGSLRQKYQNNIAAIRLLKDIENEQRFATPEEQKVLVKYVGWGGMAQQAFEPEYKGKGWEGAYDELKNLLTDAEYEAARRSATNAHYTSPAVIRGMWKAVARLGFNGGPTLEPGMGVGHFFGLAPDTMKIGMTGVELDSITGRIARQLYQGADIQVKGYQDFVLEPNQFNLAISNVPFADVHPFDKNWKQYGLPAKSGLALHDFYFAKTLYGIKPGGVVAFITSRYTMDKINDSVRRLIAEKADFLGAIRLPNNAFKENANTEVVTDIIFLQKRKPETGMSELTKQFIGTSEMEMERSKGEPGMEKVHVNDYYLANPRMVLGAHSLTGSMYRANEYTVVNKGSEKDLQEQFDAAIEMLPANIMGSMVVAKTKEMVGKEEMAMDPARLENMAIGAYFAEGGKIYRKNESGKAEVADVAPSQQARAVEMMGIKEIVKEMLYVQSQNVNDATWKPLQAKLNAAYDKFVKKYGYLTARENSNAVWEDAEIGNLLALENYDRRKKTATKTDIFRERTLDVARPITHTDDPNEALIVSLQNTGRVNLPFIAQLLSQTESEARSALIDKGLVFEEPGSDRLILAEEYLSGNVRQKLADALAAAEKDPRYSRNVQPLRDVQPRELEPHEITVRINAGAVLEAEDIQNFMAHLLKANASDFEVMHIPSLGEWKLENRWSNLKYAAVNTKTWGAGGLGAIDIVEKLLNHRSLRIMKNVGTTAEPKYELDEEKTAAVAEMAEKIEDAWSSWIWTNPERTSRITQKYNVLFNSVVGREYNGRHLQLPGLSRMYWSRDAEGNLVHPLREHQINNVWRVLQGGNKLAAHVVGAGKSLEIICAAMELKRLGLRNKSLVIVPKATLPQWRGDWLRAYPNARVLIPAKDAFTPEKRPTFLQRIATGNWDAVVLSYEQFEGLQLNKEDVSDFINKKLSSYKAALEQVKAERGSQKRRTVKDLEEMIEKYEERLKSILDRKVDEGVSTFDKLGIDQLFVDEADNFKNVEFFTKQEGLGLGTPTGSKRAFDLQMKTWFVQRKNNGGGVMFATGTPISNSLAEVYHMMRYLQADTLEALGIQNFDEWSNMFAQAVTEMEVSNTGKGFKLRTRFKKFVNVQELLNLLLQTWDIKTATNLADAGILVPGKNLPMSNAHSIVAPLTPILDSYVRHLEYREALGKKDKKYREKDPVINIISDGRLAAVDLRLINPTLPDDPNSKLNICANQAAKLWKRDQKERLTGIIFFDSVKPGSETRFDVYAELKRKMIEQGVPENEIAFVHDYEGDERKQNLFAMMNAGDIRVLIGNTTKLGVGCNVQKKLKWVMHLDVPHRPRDIQQRNGRIVRQGNENDEVEIYTLTAEGSLDAGMWERLEFKARMIDDVMSGKDKSSRNIDDESEGDFGSIKMLTIKDPKVREAAETKMKVRKLRALRQAYESKKTQATVSLHEIPGAIKDQEAHIAKMETDVRTAGSKPKDFLMTVGKKQYSERKEAGAALIKLMQEALHSPQTGVKKVGSYRGFDLSVSSSLNQFSLDVVRNAKVVLNGRLDYVIDNGLSTDPKYVEATESGLIASIEYRINNLPSLIESRQKEVEQLRADLAQYQDLVQKPFERQAELDALSKRDAELDAYMRAEEQKGQTAQRENGEWDWEHLEAERKVMVETKKEHKKLAALAKAAAKAKPRKDAKAPSVMSSLAPLTERTELNRVFGGSQNLSPSQRSAQQTSLRAGEHISFAPADPKGSGYLTNWEEFYFRVKEIATPILKMEKILRAAGVKLDDSKSLVFAVDRVRGAAGIAKQFIEDNLAPIYKEIRGQGALARELAKYLVAKRTVWLYDNKPDYIDAGYSREEAEAMVESVENHAHPAADTILRMAPQIWDYPKRLIQIKQDHGIIDDDLVEQLREPYYVPFYRDLGRDAKSKALKTPGGTRFTATSKGIRRIKGTETGYAVIDPLQSLLSQTYETITNAYRADVANTIIDIAENYPDLFGEMITKLPPRWRKQGTIEHRIEIDKVLSPQIEAMIDRLGGSLQYKARMGGGRGGYRFGSYDPKTDSIKVLYGATEGTKAHEMGHMIGMRHRLFFADLIKANNDEFTKVADSRFEGEEVPASYMAYVRNFDEKIAEFVSLYVTDRRRLARIAPTAYKAWAEYIQKVPTLRPLKEMKPSNQSGMKVFDEDNWVMDNSIPPDEDVISVLREGKLVHYRVPKELAVAVKNLHPEQLPHLLRMMTIPTRMLRTGAVGANIDFIIPNAFRDQADSAFRAKTIPFVDWFIGLKSYLTNDRIARMHRNMGGSMDSPEAGTRGLRMGAQDLIYGSQARAFIDPFWWKQEGILRGTRDLAAYAVTFPFKGIMKLAEASEMASRLGTFARYQKRGFSVERSIHASRTATLDFQRFGYNGRIPNEIIPFVNAALEGMDQFSRGIAEDPKGAVLRAFIYGFAPMLALYLWNSQNERYKMISNREKSNNWIIMKDVVGGDYWKIPKGHMIKLIINAPQMILESSTGFAKINGWGITVDMFRNISPVDASSIIPVAAKILVEPIANFDYYWQKEIEAPSVRALPSGLRFDKRTSETLKLVGKALNLSPVMMQHELQSVFAGAGQHTLLAADWALGKAGFVKPPDITDDRIPVFRRFQGKAEEWKSDMAYGERAIDKRLQEIEKASPASLVQYYGYDRSDVQKAIKASAEEEKALILKQKELIEAQRRLETLMATAK